MGTAPGWRSRKYHSFFAGVPGRSQTSFLTDLDVRINDQPLWPHLYAGPEGQVMHPEVSVASFESDPWPCWKWQLDTGELSFAVEALSPGGIRLKWTWSGTGADMPDSILTLRPFFGMRDLHAPGGRRWQWESLGAGRARVLSVPEHGTSERTEVQLLLQGTWSWEENPVWHQAFHYPEEKSRGYSSEEDLFSAGVLSASLGRSAVELALCLAEDPNDLYLELPEEKVRVRTESSPALDFVLTRPAGVLAGFPWFGEWGRDTFISLPGVVAAWLQVERKTSLVWEWSQEVLQRWGAWIPRRGMLPNVLGNRGEHSWESADATLWWCHALAGLWQISLKERAFAPLQEKFKSPLKAAISSIQSGNHRFLKPSSAGLLEVTEPHATWMDAQVDGRAMTPRVGALPEINALWFQALCLDAIWDGGKIGSNLKALAERVLSECREPDRPNEVFLHSIPLAPSFILDRGSTAGDVMHLRKRFFTPVGLRTLRPGHPEYVPSYSGSQEQRDRVYHQGVAWGWLGGHFLMAEQRALRGPGPQVGSLRDHLFREEDLQGMPISGHIAELFEAEPPFAPRGAPAQAWSVACLEEALWRQKHDLDDEIFRRGFPS